MLVIFYCKILFKYLYSDFKQSISVWLSIISKIPLKLDLYLQPKKDGETF